MTAGESKKRGASADRRRQPRERRRILIDQSSGIYGGLRREIRRQNWRKSRERVSFAQAGGGLRKTGAFANRQGGERRFRVPDELFKIAKRLKVLVVKKPRARVDKPLGQISRVSIDGARRGEGLDYRMGARTLARDYFIKRFPPPLQSNFAERRLADRARNAAQLDLERK